MTTLTTLFSARGAAALAFAVGAAALCAQAHAVAPKAKADSAAAAKKSKKAVAEKDDIDYDSNEPNVQNHGVSNYKCELGNTLTIYKNAGDDDNIAIRWKNHVHSLVRVSTTTGAERFENRANGLVWIVIPAKGLLLDGKRARQLANECLMTTPVSAAAPPDAVKS